jgi:AsmA protein
MRLLKYGLYAVVAVLLLLAVGVAVVVATFDPNDYRPQIVEQVKQRTGRDLTVGDIGLTLFPKIGAQLKQVSLAEQSGAGEFAGVDEARVYVAVFPLLSRQVVVDEVRIDGLRANLVKNADGSTNFDDLLKARQTPAAEEPGAAQGRPMRFDVQGIRITNGRVSWKDATTGNDLAVNLAELSTGRVTENRPIDVRLVASVAGTQPKLDVRTRLDATLDFDLQAQRLRFAGMNLAMQGSALDFTGIDVAVTGDVESLVQAQRIAVSKLEVKGRAARGSESYDVKLSAPAIESTPQALLVEGLTLSATGTVAGMQLTGSTLTVPALRVNLAESRLLVDRLALQARAAKAGDTIVVDLTAPRLDLAPDKATGESAVLTAKLDGPQRKGDVSLKLAGVEGSAKALRIAALTLAVDLRQQDDSIKGELRTPVTGNLEAKVFELPKLEGAFTISSRSIPRKTVQMPLNGSVRADLGAERVSVNLATRFDESSIKAKGGMNGFAKPAYDFDVAVDKLNVDRYLPQKTAQADGGQQPQGEPQKEEPIDLSALKPLNLKGALRIGQLQASNVKASNVRVDLRAKEGRLTLDPLAANLYGGSARGTLGVDANTNRFSVKQNLTGVAIGPLLRDAADKDVLEGKGTVVLDVTSQGNLVSALKKALNGSARLELRDGAVKGVDLAGAVRRVKSALGAGDVEGTGGAKEKTDFSELSASFEIRNGIAHNRDLSLKSPFIRVTGSGDVDIPQSSMNYVVKTAVVASMAVQGGRDLPELKGLTVPVRVAGPFDQLKYKVEFSQMVRGATKEQLEAAKETGREALKGAAREKLQELLGGKGQQPPAEGATGDQSQQAAPKKPEDQIKDALKGLLR